MLSNIPLNKHTKMCISILPVDGHLGGFQFFGIMKKLL